MAELNFYGLICCGVNLLGNFGVQFNTEWDVNYNFMTQVIMLDRLRTLAYLKFILRILLGATFLKFECIGRHF